MGATTRATTSVGTPRGLRPDRRDAGTGLEPERAAVESGRQGRQDLALGGGRLRGLLGRERERGAHDAGRLVGRVPGHALGERGHLGDGEAGALSRGRGVRDRLRVGLLVISTSPKAERSGSWTRSAEVDLDRVDLLGAEDRQPVVGGRDPGPGDEDERAERGDRGTAHRRPPPAARGGRVTGRRGRSRRSPSRAGPRPRPCRRRERGRSGERGADELRVGAGVVQCAQAGRAAGDVRAVGVGHAGRLVDQPAQHALSRMTHDGSTPCAGRTRRVARWCRRCRGTCRGPRRPRRS